MNRTLALLLLIPGSAALEMPERSPVWPQTQQRRIDSLVLARTACAGSCPAYRLTVAGNGVVTFEGDVHRGRDSLAADRVAALVARVERAGFFALPPSTRDDRSMCGAPATGFSTITVTVYSGASTKTVTDYGGCLDSRLASVAGSVRQAGAASGDSILVELRGLQDAIDSLTLSGRWVRPAHVPANHAMWIGTVNDSVVLERPTYRVALSSGGDVRFTTLGSRDRVRGADTLSSLLLNQFTLQAEAAGFFDLPDSLRTDRYYCPVAASGSAPVTVTFFRGNARRSVVDDTRCGEPVDRPARIAVTRLRAFQAGIDSTLGTARWTKGG